MKEIRWGIIGCGGIAHEFASSLKALENGTLLAGASRTPGRAQAFAQKHGMERIYTDYGSLAADPDVDAVYIATTHNFHFENMKLCLESGKHVLCEKPFTVNAAQTQELIGLAREKKLFMMEAVWARFLPAVAELRRLLDAGVIGDVRTVLGHFSINGFGFGETHRLRAKALAGGALLDLGIYPITLAAMVFGGHPTRIQSSVVLGDTGVDDRSFYLLDYADGCRAELSSSFMHHAPVEGVVCGTEGYIRLPGFPGTQELQLFRAGKEPEVLRFPYGEGEGFSFEIAHAMERIAAGQMESDILPLSETLALMRTMDVLRTQWGLEYPGE